VLVFISCGLELNTRFVAQIVFGVIVTRGPRSHLAEAGMAELEQACDLFSMAGKYNRRAAKAHVRPPTFQFTPR
jgi:hypothetical protein